MSELRVSLPPVLDAALAARVAQGDYLDAPEYVRDLMRRDLNDFGAKRRWLKAMIDEGFASGIDDREPEEILAEIIAEDPDLRG